MLKINNYLIFIIINILNKNFYSNIKMAIIAIGRVDKKLLLIVFTFIIRAACLIALYEGYGL